MSRSRGLTSIPPALRRQLAVTAALASERLMEVHLRYAMELVDRTRDQLEPARALSIYARLHHLSESMASRLQHDVFVALGRRSPPKAPAGSGSGAPDGPETPQSILGIIRHRLRGRINSELREWLEYHTGRAETELLWAHVENALQFIDLLEAEVGLADAVEVYASELAVPPARIETIYYLTLAHRSALAFPSVPGGSVSAEPQVRSTTDPPKRLKIVSTRRVAR
jgi:hypothetical protein